MGGFPKRGVLVLSRMMHVFFKFGGEIYWLYPLLGENAHMQLAGHDGMMSLQLPAAVGNRSFTFIS